MKKIKVITIGAFVFLVVNWIFVVLYTERLNLITFLLTVVLLPIILYSFGIAGILRRVSIKSKSKMVLLFGFFSILYSVTTYAMQRFIGISVDSIIRNTELLNQGSDSLSISGIEYSNGASSYVLIFMLVFIFLSLFSVLLEKLKEREGNVCK